jgi:hypothetical protein
MKMKPCGFGSVHGEEDTLLEAIDPERRGLEATLTGEEGRPIHTGTGTPNNNSSGVTLKPL